MRGDGYFDGIWAGVILGAAVVTLAYGLAPEIAGLIRKFRSTRKVEPESDALFIG